MAKNQKPMRTISMELDDWNKINEIRGAMKAKEFMHLIANTVKVEYTKTGGKIIKLHKQVEDINSWLGEQHPDLNEEGLHRKEQELIENGTITQIDNHWIIREEKQWEI